MFALETRNYVLNTENLHFIDSSQEDQYLSHSLPDSTMEAPLIKSNSMPQVSKSYEIVGKCISESYFTYDETDTDFISDFSKSHKNGILLIMTDEMSEFDINFLAEHMGEKLKYIIYYRGDASQFNLVPSKGLTFIRTFSLKSAVIAAYRNAKNGQAIIFPKVDSDFDFFQYVDTLN